MKIACVIPIHRRPKITIATINRLKMQTLPLYEIIVVGDSDIERAVAKETGVIYFERKNQPLGAKWQLGINYCKEINVDAILICGSDKWITNNWCEEMSKYIEKDFDDVGLKNRHVSFFNKNEKPVIIKRTYRKGIKLPTGGGRLVSKRILEKINWKLYPSKKRRLDFLVTRKISKNGGKTKKINDNSIKALEIKSNEWETLNKFRYKSVNIVNLKTIKNHKKWLNDNFPGAVKMLNEIVGNIKW